MPFWKPGDPNPEPPRIGMPSALVYSARETHQLGGMLKRINLAIVILRIARQIAPQRENIADASLRILA